jgi:hypothetical protein
MHKVYEISAADGITLAHYGITYVKQLFGVNEMNGNIDINQNADYPMQLQTNHPWLIEKCKNLRAQVKNKGFRECKTTGTFFQNVNALKFSGLCRRMRRRAMDESMPGPPSYFTRRRDGIPVPSLGLFMKGYRNLFTMDIASKTLENSFLLMNRQTWTNEKQFLSGMDGMDESNEPSCALCGERENTMHLMFECEHYSEPLWKLLENIINETKARTSENEGTINRIQMHAFLVLYNVWAGAPDPCARAIMTLIQEVKRNITFRRYKRETTNIIVRCSRTRMLGHLLAATKKLDSLWTYQGKNSVFFREVIKTITDKI